MPKRRLNYSEGEKRLLRTCVRLATGARNHMPERLQGSLLRRVHRRYQEIAKRRGYPRRSAPAIRNVWQRLLHGETAHAKANSRSGYRWLVTGIRHLIANTTKRDREAARSRKLEAENRKLIKQLRAVRKILAATAAARNLLGDSTRR